MSLILYSVNAPFWDITKTHQICSAVLTMRITVNLCGVDNLILRTRKFLLNFDHLRNDGAALNIKQSRSRIPVSPPTPLFLLYEMHERLEGY